MWGYWFVTFKARLRTVIHLDHQYCVDGGRDCRPCTVEIDGEKRIVAYIHRRIQVVIEHYKDDTKAFDYSDFLVCEASGRTGQYSFSMEVADKDLMPIWTGD